MSDHGPGIPIQLTSNSMFQHSSNLVTSFVTEQPQRPKTKALLKHIAGKLGRAKQGTFSYDALWMGVFDF